MKAHMKHWSKQRKLNLKAWSYSFVFVWSHLEGTLTVVTSEARFVVHLVVSSELFHPIHFLFTCCALLGSACKWCHLKWRLKIPLGELNRGWRLSFFLVFFSFSKILWWVNLEIGSRSCSIVHWSILKDLNKRQIITMLAVCIHNGRFDDLIWG